MTPTSKAGALPPDMARAPTRPANPFAQTKRALRELARATQAARQVERTPADLEFWHFVQKRCRSMGQRAAGRLHELLRQVLA